MVISTSLPKISSRPSTASSTVSTIAWDAYSSRPSSAASVNSAKSSAASLAKKELDQLLEAAPHSRVPGSEGEERRVACCRESSRKHLPDRRASSGRQASKARPSRRGKDFLTTAYGDLHDCCCGQQEEFSCELDRLKQDFARKENALIAERDALAKTVPRAPSHWLNQRLSQGQRLKHEWPEGSDAIMAMLRQASTHEVCAGRDGVFNITAVKGLKVWRVENPMLWKQYKNKAAEMSERHRLLNLDCPRIAVDRYRSEEDQPECLRRKTLDASLNEVRLWHGTKVWNVGKIVEEGFDERVCCLNGMFGAGLYFANETCKAGQYAKRSDGGSIGSGSKASHWFVLSRVLLGRSHFTREAMPETRKPPDNCDSVIYTPTVYADVGHHTEFIVYDRFQCYPEYLVEAMI